MRIWFTHKPKVIWFNAWRHDKADALWAAFALSFLEEISKQRHRLDILPLLGYIKLFLLRFEKKGLPDLFRAIFQIVLSIVASALIALFSLFLFFPHLKQPPLIRQLGEYITKNVTVPEQSADFSSKESKTGNSTVQQQNQQTATKSSPSQTSKSIRQSATLNSNKQGVSAQGNGKENKDWLDQIIPWIIKNLLAGAASGSAGLSILYIWQRLHKAVGGPKKDLTEYLKAPNYDKQIPFIEQFHKDFKKIVNAYAGKGNKVYVFIDDLDRCEVPKSAELMQAINLMISNDPQLIFILGMDREKIAAGLAVKYKEVIPYLYSSVQDNTHTGISQTSLRGVEYGYTFIEKFVQLPFQIPELSDSQFKVFLSKLSSPELPKDSWWQPIWNFFEKPIYNNAQRFLGWIESFISESQHKTGSDETKPSESPQRPETTQQIQQRLEKIKVKTGSDSKDVHDILSMVAPVLDWNPRRLKQFLNLFRLRAYIASATGLFYGTEDVPALTFEQLGKFTAIGLKYPLLIADLKKDNRLLAMLYKSVYDNTTINWYSETELLKLLYYKATEYPEYSLEKVNVKQLLQISPSFSPPSPVLPVWWQEIDNETSPDGKLIAAIEKDDTVRLWDTSGDLVAVLKGHQGRVTSVKFSPDAQLIATGGEDATVRLWDTSGNLVDIHNGRQGRVTSVKFSPDGKLIATSGEDGALRLLGIKDRRVAFVNEFHRGRVTSIEFSPDGEYLAAGGEDGTVRLVDTNFKRVQVVLKGHQGRVTSVKFDPHGWLIARVLTLSTIR